MPNIVSALGRIVQLQETAGEPKHDVGIDTTAPGAEKTILTVTVPVAKKRNLLNVFVTSSATGKMIVRKGASTIATGRIGPGHPNFLFKWEPVFPITAGDVVTVAFHAAAGFPIADIETFLMSAETNL